MKELNNSYEKAGVKNRLKEAVTLSVIVIIAFIISLLAMDILVLPVAFIAVKDKVLFTHIVKYLFLVIILIALFYLLVKKIYTLRKMGLPAPQIMRNILLKPFTFLITVLVGLFIGFILIMIVNFLHQQNYYLLYKIINI